MRKAGLLGKKPPNYANIAKTIKFSAIFNIEALPTPPAVFGHYNKLQPLGMLGNDTAGDCVFAGYAHHAMYWNASQGRPVSFSTNGVLSDYSSYTGYVPGNPFTDQGTDMSAAPDYFKNPGVVDANGNRHRIDANIALDVGNLDELWQALYLFDGCGIGVNLPQSAQNQFSQGQVWSIVSGDRIIGGHYVAGFGRNSKGNIVVGTWGDLQGVEPSWFVQYNDELQAYLSLESLDSKGLSPEQYDKGALESYLIRLGDNPRAR